jgi:hypothetical protein
MKPTGKVWGLSLLMASTLLGPACGGDDDDSMASGGKAGGGAAGTHTSGGSAGGAGVGGQQAGNGGHDLGGGGSGGASDCAAAQVDRASGVVTCGDVKYRESVGQGCSYAPLSAGGQGSGGAATGGAGGDSACDPARCNDKPRGYCEAEGYAGAGPTTCHYGCITDSDCATSEICLCADPAFGGRCVFATCKSDGDCHDGTRCASSSSCDQFSCSNAPACAVP